MAERVVDVLEAIEIEEEERGRAGGVAGLGEDLRQALAQVDAVGKVGQRVVTSRDRRCAIRRAAAR